MSFFAELRRRNVVRVGIAYLVGGWLLLQLTDVLSELLDLPDVVGRAVVAVVAIGLPIALFFAWAYEVTPEGIKRESEVDRSQSIAPQTGKKLNNAILVLMALAIVYLLFDKFSGVTSPPAATTTQQVVMDAQPAEIAPSPVAPAEVSELSIAVLPFDNRSNREEDQFFTDGIHDDLLTTIAKIGSMKVISRTSVMEYKGTTKKIPQIAGELGVANILEGGIQRSGNQVRINVQLIDAQTDEHLWAEIYDRELTADNLFAIQSEISNAIARELKTTLTPEEQQRIDQAPTRSLAAFEAYAQGKQLMATRRIDDLEKAAEAFQAAVDIDPEFALAWVGVADSHALLSNYRQSGRDAFIELRQRAVDRALAIDPALGEAFAALGSIQDDQGQPERAEASYRRAIELSPNYATAWHWLSNSEIIRNDPLRGQEALLLAQKAYELDPRSMIIGANLAGRYARMGEYERAEQLYLSLVDLYPEAAQSIHGLGDLYIYGQGRYAEGMSIFAEMSRRDPRNVDAWRHQAEIALSVGDLQSAERFQQHIADLDPDHWWLGVLDAYKAAINENDAALREALNWTLPRRGNDPFVRVLLGDLSLISGDIEQARNLYLDVNPGLLNPDSWGPIIRDFPGSACIFSWILGQTGDTALGEQLAARTTAFLLDELPKVNKHPLAESVNLCLVASGDYERALDVMERQLSHGHTYLWPIYRHLPIYDPIRQHPRFLDLMVRLEQKMDEQRRLIEAMDMGAAL